MDLRIRRLRTECGCEAGAVGLLGAFLVSAAVLFLGPPSDLSPLARWLTASTIAVVTGLAAKLTAIAHARRQLRTLLATEDS